MAFTIDQLPPRFRAKLLPTPGGCWLWTAAKDRHGYGRYKVPGRTVFAHRYAYETLVGPLDQSIDHLCRTPACCNPVHLDPCSQATNLRRGRSQEVILRNRAAITHCPQGHPYDEANTYWYGANRLCRACRRERARRAA
jgi:hypothetical protein